MSEMKQTTKEALVFEPLLIEILEDNITEQHARILALLFRLGGYTTLNVLTNLIGIAQPTVSIRVDELVKMGYIRKNTELMPIALVLLLHLDDFEEKLRKRIEAQRNAVQFLQKASEIRDLQMMKNTFLRAIRLLYNEEDILARMIAFVYLNGLLSINDLFNLVYPKDDEDIVKERKKKKAFLVSTLNSNYETFHVIYKKHQEKEILIRPRLPLKLFTKNRLTYIESINTHYNDLLLKLHTSLSKEYEPIIPHQQLSYPSELKMRIDSCLKHYSTVRIIDNSIYKSRNNGKGVIGLILGRKNFSKDHKIMILSNESKILPKTANTSQFETHSLKGRINRDYMTRDFIIFGDHGCIVIPSQPSSIPYYNITPSFTTTILDIFKSNWRKKDAI